MSRSRFHRFGGGSSRPPSLPPGTPIEVWFRVPRPSGQDEARVGQQGTLTRLWARKGSRPRAPRDRRYTWVYLFGAICPQRAVSAGLVLPAVDTTTMSLHLAGIAQQVVPGAHAVLGLDGAGYHGTARTRRPRGLVVPETITLLHLPSASPERNPIENVWQDLRQNKLANRVFKDYRHIVDACCDAWNSFAKDQATVASITKRAWAKVNQ